MALDAPAATTRPWRPTAGSPTTQLPNGAWHNYYRRDGSIEDSKLDTNVCAYVATGVWHHWLMHRDARHVAEPVADRRAGARLGARLRRADGLALWAIEADGTRPWDYALLTGSSSIAHALQCGARLGAARRAPATELANAADVHDRADRSPTTPSAFEPKERWAMDWYYPVLSGALDRRAPAKARLAEGWDDVRDGGPRRALRQRRAVGDGVGDRRVRARVRRHRRLRHRRRPAALDPRPPARRRRVLDRPRPSASTCRSRSTSTRRTRRRRSSSPPTRSAAPPRLASSPALTPEHAPRRDLVLVFARPSSQRPVAGTAENGGVRRRLLDNPLARTVLSAWSWLVLGVVVVVWLPLVAIVGW